MATEASFIEYVRDQAGLGARLATRRMFGEYAVYVDERVVALACDNQVFLKPTPEGQRLAPHAVPAPPYPGAKPHLRLDEELEDADLFQRLLLATAAALPPPRPKPQKQGATRKSRGRSGK